MRTVNIYRAGIGSSEPALVSVAMGCIQTKNADLNVTPNGKLYMMSDGTTVCYPVQTAQTEMKLCVECTKAKAEAIRKALHYTELYFEGIRIGDAEGVSGIAYRAFVMGTVTFEVKYATAGIYIVTIPLRLDASGETLRYEEVPA